MLAGSHFDFACEKHIDRKLFLIYNENAHLVKYVKLQSWLSAENSNKQKLCKIVLYICTDDILASVCFV